MLAASGGHLEELQWARQHGCEWDTRTCCVAAEGGHLQVLQWARQNGCEWDAGTCSSAAEGGHLEVLKWARQNGCEWNSATLGRARAGGHMEVRSSSAVSARLYGPQASAEVWRAVDWWILHKRVAMSGGIRAIYFF